MLIQYDSNITLYLLNTFHLNTSSRNVNTVSKLDSLPNQIFNPVLYNFIIYYVNFHFAALNNYFLVKLFVNYEYLMY